MIANLENIQIVYNEIPNTWIVDGVRIDNYKQSEDNYKQSEEHFEHGWREVVIPTITEYQRLGNEFILVDDIITKEVIDFTAEEIAVYNLSKAIQIDFEYKDRITKLLTIPIQKVNCRELEEVPADILAEKERLKTECNNKIIALGITYFSFRKKVTINLKA